MPGLKVMKRTVNKNALIKLYNTVKKQLASYRTTVNGDNPHYHYYEIDSEGNGQTVSTIATDRVVIEVDPHEHKISKWKVSSSKNHTHGMDIVEKAIKKNAPENTVFKAFEKYHNALRGYYKPMMGTPVRKSKVTKNYLEKVVIKVLKLMVHKAKPAAVGAISERSDGKYKKVAPGQWEKIPKKKELTDEGDGESKPSQDGPVMTEQSKELLSGAYNELVEMEDLETSNKLSARLDSVKEQGSPEGSLKALDMVLGDIEDGEFPGVDTSSKINTILLDLWSSYAEARKK